MRTLWRPAKRALMALAVVCAGLWPGATAAQQEVPLGQRVLAVRVVGEDGRVYDAAAASLAQRADSPLDAGQVRQSIRQLYRSGSFEDIRAEAVRVDGGLRLDFIVRENFYINMVRVEGLRHPANQALALSALRLEPGVRFRRTELDEAVERMRDVLRDEAFYRIRITPELLPRPATRQMDIVVRVEEGPRTLIEDVTLRVLEGTPPPELLRRSKLKPGDIAKSARLQGAADRLRKYLFKQGYLAARVNAVRGEYHPEKNAVPIVMEVLLGAKARVEIDGARISQSTLRRILPIYQEGAVDEDLLQEGRRTIRDYLESKGFFDSRVTHSVGRDEKSGQQVITYAVERGPQRRLLGVTFQGNRYFDSELLRLRLRIRPAAFLSPGRFNRRLLDEDMNAIRGLYVANGFADAKAEARLLENYQGKPENLFIEFQIAEGEQKLVGDLKMEGFEGLPAAYVREQAVNSLPGQPFSEFNAAADRDNILALYFNEGFTEARFEYSTSSGDAPNRVNLLYRIAEGPRTRVKRIFVGGNQFTHEDIIRNELRIAPEEPLSLGKVIESQRRLYNLGVFSRVQIAPQNPAGTETEKNVLVLLEESKRFTLGYGAGFELQRLGGRKNDPVGGSLRASPRGILEFSHNNVLGRAHTFSLQTRLSTIQGRALASYTAPNLIRRPALALQISGFIEKASDVRTFTSRRAEASLQFIQRISPVTSFAYRYVFRRVVVDPDTLQIDPNQIPLVSQPTLISGFGAAWVRDRRDNPASAARGDFNTLEANAFFKGLKSSANFVRVFAQNSSFHRVKGPLVFARSVRFGMQQVFGNSSELDIPLPERFFAGGGYSLRGFGLNQAGPRDPVTGFALGGLALLVFNNELRFPMRFPYAGDKLGGAFFYDAGNVFTRVENITLRSKPSLLASAPGGFPGKEADYFSHTIGFSLRYATPIGPLRFDIGFLMNPGQFTIQTAPSVVETRRVPRVQFFFNIGSMF